MLWLVVVVAPLYCFCHSGLAVKWIFTVCRYFSQSGFCMDFDLIWHMRSDVCSSSLTWIVSVPKIYAYVNLLNHICFIYVQPRIILFVFTPWRSLSLIIPNLKHSFYGWYTIFLWLGKRYFAHLDKIDGVTPPCCIDDFIITKKNCLFERRICLILLCR